MKTQQGFPDSPETMLPLIDEIGSAKHENHYPVPWAWAGSSPFQWMKQVASHFGGTRNPVVISWPKRIKDTGGLRSQFHHVIDIAPDDSRRRRHRGAENRGWCRATGYRRGQPGLHLR